MTTLLTSQVERIVSDVMADSAVEQPSPPTQRLKELGRNVEAIGRIIESLAGGLGDQGLTGGYGATEWQTSTIGDLKPRSLEVLSLMAQGHSNWGIAEALALQPKTVENHINSIYQTLNVSNHRTSHPRVQAVLNYIDYTSGKR